MPCLRRNKVRVSSRTRSAPQTARRRLFRSPSSPARAYWVMKVSVESRMVAPDSANAPHDFARLQRGGMADHLHPRDQRQQHPHRQAEAMKHGQGIEQHIAVIKVDMGAHLGDIGQDVLMAERHALGMAFGAGGEKDRGRLVVPGFAGQRARARGCRPNRSACRTGKVWPAHPPDRPARRLRRWLPPHLPAFPVR